MGGALIAVGCGPPRAEAAPHVLAPAELAARLADVEAGRLVVLYVGPPGHFEEGHVPGARRLPPVSTNEGERALARELDETRLEVDVVVYCGCCPYQHCPSVRPATSTIRASGRPRTWWLDLPGGFAVDWRTRGYPVATGPGDVPT